jgi:excisionase family DNA binding protein
MGEKKMDAAYMTMDQASQYSGISINTLRKKVAAKAFPSYKPGKRILLRVVDLDAYIRGFKK